MSDSNRVSMRYVEEVVFGVNPGTDMTALRYTSEGMSPNLSFTESDEIRSDRNVSDTIQTDSEPSGDVNFELSYGAYDDFFRGALFSGAWSTPVAVSETDISAINADSSFNTAGGDFLADGVIVGQWLEVRGFTTNPTNNGYFRVVSATSAKIVVEGGVALIDESPVTAVTMGGSYIRNGVTRTSFTVEKEFSDITQFEVFDGAVVSTLDMAVENSSILTGAFNLMALTEILQQVTAGTGTVTAAPTNDVMNASANVLKIVEGGVILADCVQNMSISLNNNLRGIKCVGTLGNEEVGSGRCAVDGDMSLYFADEAIYDKFSAVSATSIAFIVEDVDGNAYAVTLPRVKFTSWEALAGGADQDVVVDLTYMAVYDPTTACSIQIDRFSA